MSIIDEHTRERLGGLVERSIIGDRLIDELDRLVLLHRNPVLLRSGNGPELACDASSRLGRRTRRTVLHPARKPWRDGFVESFNPRIRDRWLNIKIARSLPKPAW